MAKTSVVRKPVPAIAERAKTPEDMSDAEYFRSKQNSESFGYLIREANRHFSQFLQILVARHGITTSQWYFLRVLWDRDGLTQAELSTRVGIMTPTTVIALNTLEKKGLIKRHRHPTDKRKLCIYLTKHGRQMERMLLPCGKQVNSVAAGRLPGETTALVREALRTMCENLARQLEREAP